MRKHLSRLDRVWINDPVYFITTCTHRRQRILASAEVAQILVHEWTGAQERHRWLVGRYVIMPDHVHFFAAPGADSCTLSEFVGAWKRWTSRVILEHLRVEAPLWQAEFFDHVLRSQESAAEKWEYVRTNPVRHGLVQSAEEWPFAGEIAVL